MRVGFIGGVNSSLTTLKKLVEHDINIVAVFGYKPSENVIVSGYNDLEDFSLNNGLNFVPFTRINERTADIVGLELDVLFVVGISQLVSEDIINAPKLGCIGYHPTLLPRGRGRAPIAWLVHECEDGAANFFLLNDVADSGPIFVQEPFSVREGDNAESVEEKLLLATEVALDRWLPELKKGEWNPIPQQEYFATEYGIRKPDDGLIDWKACSIEISRLIRAASRPHPGAYTFYNNDKLIIESCKLEQKMKIKGCVGRILKIDNDSALIQTGQGLIWISNIRPDLKLKVGDRLGYQAEDEIYKLKNQILNLSTKINSLLKEMK
ncbi:methionyl-tRNA formyltransferase [Vibrio breoganii]